MKRIITIIGLVALAKFACGQTISPELVSLGNFVQRMFEASPFEGVKVIEDYNNTYMISLAMLERSKYSSELVMNKVAAAKARSNVNKFLNGTQLSTDFYVQTEKIKSDSTVTKEMITYDIIREKSYGIVESMKVLTTFNADDDKYYIYIIFKEIENIKKK